MQTKTITLIANTYPAKTSLHLKGVVITENMMKKDEKPAPDKEKATEPTVNEAKQPAAAEGTGDAEKKVFRPTKPKAETEEIKEEENPKKKRRRKKGDE